MVMVGARKGGPDDGIVYPVNDVAARHGASVLEETRSGKEAYARFPDPRRRRATMDGCRERGLMVPKRAKETLPEGLGAAGPGWFVLNARDARWWKRQGLGRWADLEG